MFKFSAFQPLNLPRKYFYKAPLLFHGLDKYSFTCIASI